MRWLLLFLSTTHPIGVSASLGPLLSHCHLGQHSLTGFIHCGHMYTQGIEGSIPSRCPFSVISLSRVPMPHSYAMSISLFPLASISRCLPYFPPLLAHLLWAAVGGPLTDRYISLDVWAIGRSTPLHDRAALWVL